MICEYDNCRNIEFGKEDKYLLTDSDDRNKGKLTISHISDTNNPIECNISGIHSKFLSQWHETASVCHFILIFSFQKE